jgi:hypothetical protein
MPAAYTKRLSGLFDSCYRKRVAFALLSDLGRRYAGSAEKPALTENQYKHKQAINPPSASTRTFGRAVSTGR